MLTQEQLDLLKDGFPPEAVSADTSRGFELTSIKAAYIIERLNDVFGVCGTGWRYCHSNFEIETAGGSEEVMTEIALQYAIGEGGVFPIHWDGMQWTYLMWEGFNVWSYPVFSAGGKHVVKGRFTDARKSAITDGLTKAASMIGVAHEAFKGLLTKGRKTTGKKTTRKQTKSSPRAKPQPTKWEPENLDKAAALVVTGKQSGPIALGDCKPHQLLLVFEHGTEDSEKGAAKLLIDFLSEHWGTEQEVTYNTAKEFGKSES